MTIPEYSEAAQASLATTHLLFKGMGIMAMNPRTEQNPDGIINAGVAVNSTIKDLLIEKLNSLTGVIDSDLEYNAPNGSPDLRSEIADVFNRHLNPHTPVNADDICVHNGCTEGIESISFATCNPGDHILVPGPCYGALDNDMGARARANVNVVGIPLDEAMSVSQIKYFEEEMRKIESSGGNGKAKMLFLMNPHNPLCACYPKETLRAFFEFASKYNLFVVVDEIYALSEFGQEGDQGYVPFESVLSWDDLGDYINPSQVLVMHGLSKDFGLNGFRMGWTVSPWNKDITRVLSSFSLFGYRPSYTDRLVTELLADHEFVDNLFEKSRDRLRKNYIRTTEVFDKHGIEYVPCSAGHFIWFRLPKSAYVKAFKVLGKSVRSSNAAITAEDDLSTWESIMVNDKVYFPTGQAFHSTEPGWYRFTFSIVKEDLEVALERLLKACEL